MEAHQESTEHLPTPCYYPSIITQVSCCCYCHWRHHLCCYHSLCALLRPRHMYDCLLTEVVVWKQSYLLTHRIFSLDISRNRRTAAFLTFLFPNSLEDMYACLTQPLKGYHFAQLCVCSLHALSDAWPPSAWHRSNEFAQVDATELPTLNNFPSMEPFLLCFGVLLPLQYVKEEEWEVVIIFYYDICCPFGRDHTNVAAGVSAILSVDFTSQSEALLLGENVEPSVVGNVE